MSYEHYTLLANVYHEVNFLEEILQLSHCVCSLIYLNKLKGNPYIAISFSVIMSSLLVMLIWIHVYNNI